jgi:hypothetical protein
MNSFQPNCGNVSELFRSIKGNSQSKMVLKLFGNEKMTNPPEKDIHIIKGANQNLNNIVHCKGDYGNGSR